MNSFLNHESDTVLSDGLVGLGLRFLGLGFREVDAADVSAFAAGSVLRAGVGLRFLGFRGETVSFGFSSPVSFVFFEA